MKKIRAQCFEQQYFSDAQANRLVQHILAEYGNYPQFPWEKYPNFATFRHSESQKWYALVMRLSKEKFAQGNGEVDVVNLKINSSEIPLLIRQVGIFPAYHMSKKHWISVLLDDSISDENLFSLLAQSYALSNKKPSQRK